MKKTIIICDECSEELSKAYIELGSDSGNGLCYKNTLRVKKCKEGVKHALGNYHDLHFCSEKCFIDFFFGKEGGSNG